MDNTSFMLKDKIIGSQKPCLIIGEIAQAHDGSLGMAHAYIDAIAKTGADAAKFQTHIADAESTLFEPWRIKFSKQDETRIDYWHRMEFSEDQWLGLKEHCEELGLIFLSSPFSVEAVDMLDRMNICSWKIASGEVGNQLLMERILSTKRPILLSSGMSTIDEIDVAVKKIRDSGSPLAVMQCTSNYPCPPEKIGLNMIPFYRDRYLCPVGLSDHSGYIYPSLAAATIGIEILEVHVTLSREMFGPDVIASVTTSELHQIVEGVRFIEKMNYQDFDKNKMALEIEPLREIFTKSVITKMDLPIGTIIKKEHLTLKKPGTGIKSKDLELVLGRTINRNIKANEFLKWTDFD